MATTPNITNAIVSVRRVTGSSCTGMPQDELRITPVWSATARAARCAAGPPDRLICYVSPRPSGPKGRAAQTIRLAEVALRRCPPIPRPAPPENHSAQLLRHLQRHEPQLRDHPSVCNAPLLE